VVQGARAIGSAAQRSLSDWYLGRSPPAIPTASGASSVSGSPMGVSSGAMAMATRRKSSQTAATTRVLASGTASAGGAVAGPIEDMAGYWTGVGTVLLTSGSTERVKCVVIYRIGSSGTQIKQTMRCASTDYKIDSAAELRVNGEHVSGTWEEKTYSATGDVTGRYTGTSFVLSIKGQNFTAAMNVGLSSCKQSISITPQGLDVRRISMNLAKC